MAIRKEATIQAVNRWKLEAECATCTLQRSWYKLIGAWKGWNSFMPDTMEIEPERGQRCSFPQHHTRAHECGDAAEGGKMVFSCSRWKLATMADVSDD